MLEPLIDPPHEEIARLREQLAAVEQENANLRSRLAEDPQSVEFTRDSAQHASDSALKHRLLEATTRVASGLLTIAPLDMAVNAALQILGEALDTDRVGVVENFANPSDSSFVWWRQIYEWTSPHAIPQITHPDLGQGSYEGIEAWYVDLSQGQGISCLLEDMPEPFRSGQAALGLKALHFVPIFVEHQYWGAIGFDDCREAKYRSPAELAVLKIAADCIGSAIQRDYAQHAALKAEQEHAAELAKANEVLRQREHEVQRSYRILEATAQAADALLTIGNLDQAVNTALQILGESLETDRVKILEYVCDHPSNLSSAYYTMSHEWITAGTVSQLSHPSSSRISICGAEAFMESLYQNDGFGGLLQEWPESFWSAFEAVQAKGIYCVPIRVEGQRWGVLVYDDCQEARHRNLSQLAVLKIAANCIGSAIQRQRMQRARQEAERQVLLEREKAAQERAVELAKANDALQATIDAMARVSDLDEFVPAVLQIVGQTFGTKNCSFYEHYANQPIYLRYWRMGDRVLRPADLLALDGDLFALVRRLADGFSVSDTYLGTPVRERTRAVILDHGAGSSVSEFDTFCCQNGWDVELNVPLIVNGFADGALLIYRSAGATFTPSEIALAQTLGQQLALAMQASRLAAEGRSTAVEAAIAREQKQAAQERAAELAKANAVLRGATERLASEPSLEAFLEHVLAEACHEAIEAGAIFLYDEHQDHLSLVVSHGFNADYLYPVQQSIPTAEFPTWSMLLQAKRPIVVNMDEQPELFAEETLAWHLAQGHRGIVITALLLGDRPLGVLGIATCNKVSFKETDFELFQALAQQATLAIQLTRLAKEAKQVAVAREQEQAALERTTALAKVNENLQTEVIERHRAERSTQGQSEALVRMLTAFAAAPVLDNFLGIVLREIVEQLGGRAGSIWLYDEAQNTTLLHFNYEDGQIQQGSQIARSGRDHTFLRQWNTDYLQVLRQQKILIQNLQQFANDPAYEAYYTHNHQHGIKTILVAALFFGETLLGSIILRCTQRHEYKSEDLALIRVLTHQAALAIQLTRLAEQSKQAAISEERNRMAREIHDTLAQSFTSIRMQLEAAIRLLTRNPEQAQACITLAQDLAKTGVTAARRSVWALQPEAEDYRHLSTTLQRLAAQQTIETSIQVEVVIVGTPYTLPPDIGMNLLRIGQEALNNATRHASAQTILTLTYAPHQIQLQIQDDGQGFDPQQLSSGGFGLIGMQQRSDRLGGAFTIHSQRGRGTEVKVIVPILKGIQPEETPIH